MYSYNISAIAGEDYVSLSREIIFDEDSEKSVYISIPIINDECLEERESFYVNINSSMDCVNLPIETTQEIYIYNDDGMMDKCLHLCV